MLETQCPAQCIFRTGRVLHELPNLQFSCDTEKVGDSKTKYSRDLPAGLVAKTPSSNAGGMGFTPAWGIKILHATRCSQILNK